MEKFRQGKEPSQFAHPPKPKKKIRGYVVCMIFMNLQLNLFWIVGVLLCSMASGYVLADINSFLLPCSQLASTWYNTASTRLHRIIAPCFNSIRFTASLLAEPRDSSFQFH